jgi:uncharacterized GH25 family protein
MIIRTIETLIAVGALTLGALPPAAAHDLFLRPDRFPQAGDRSVTVGAVLGFNFPAGTFAPQEHLKLRARLGDGRTVTLPSAQKGIARQVTCPLPGKGASVVYADYTAYLTRTENGNEYLPKDEATGKKIQRSVWVGQCSKLILSQGADASRIQQPVGLAIEIVPEVDPATLKAGDLLPVRVLLEGKPFGYTAGRPAEIKAVYAGFQEDDDTWAFLGRLDREGRARIKLTQPGTWMALVEHTEETPDSPKADRKMWIGTLVFHVPEGAARTTARAVK